MRGPTHETNSTDDESEGEPSSPKRDKVILFFYFLIFINTR